MSKHQKDRKREILRKLNESGKIDQQEYNDQILELEKETEIKKGELKSKLDLMTDAQVENLYLRFVPIRLNC